MKFRYLATPLLLLLLDISGLSTVQVKCQDPVVPYITFKGQVLPNNSYVGLRVMQRFQDVLNIIECHTDLTTCCNVSYGPHSGQWYSPYTGVDLSQASTFSQGLVSLRMNRTMFLGRTGIYKCQIDTSTSIHSSTVPGSGEAVYVGLFRAFQPPG